MQEMATIFLKPLKKGIIIFVAIVINQKKTPKKPEIQDFNILATSVTDNSTKMISGKGQLQQHNNIYINNHNKSTKIRETKLH
jgi:hypothetical protein